MTYSIYQFEAVSIQDYILADGKIKTMVGASELLEAITNELLDSAIQALGLKAVDIDQIKGQTELVLEANKVIFPRRAGSVFQMVLQNAEKAQEFAALWPIMVSNFAPGLRFSAALATDKDYQKAVKDVRDALTIQKNQPQPLLPESTPLTVRYQRTGKAQVGTPNNKNSGLDWTMQAKTDAKFDLLARKFLFQDPFSSEAITAKREYTFPKQFEHSNSDAYWAEAFPFRSTDPGNHTVAIVHADGNGLGQYLHGIFSALKKLPPAKAISAYQAFSVGLDEATQAAARLATAWLAARYAQDGEKNPYKEKLPQGQPLPLPMRPIILGGDDLTVVIRADYAIGFIQEFTQHFETKTKTFLSKLNSEYKDVFSGLPEFLSCTTGMLFLRSNQPFNLGYALAEGLCSAAKKQGRVNDSKALQNVPSLISFMRTTNTLFDDYDTQFKQELETTNGQLLSAMPYAFKEGSHRATLAELFNLREYFDEDNSCKLKPSAIRRYTTHLYSNPDYAQTFWSRWERQCLDSPALKDTWLEFNNALERIKQKSHDGQPIADLVTLFALEIYDLGDIA